MKIRRHRVKVDEENPMLLSSIRLYHLCLASTGRKRFPGLLLVLLGFYCPVVSGLDESRLWLPISYKHYYFELLASGLVAEDQHECASVVEGTVDLDRSKRDKPVFRLLCRNSEGRTFNVLVDGLSRTILTPEFEIDQLLTPEQRATRARRRAEEEERRQRQLAAEKARRHQQLIERYWAECERALQPIITNMLSLEWVEDPQPAMVEAERAEFARNFTARDFAGTTLFFTVECEVTAEAGAEAVIMPTARVKDRF